jgi:hypothetical protein
MTDSKDQIEKDAIAAEWGLALDAEAANTLTSAPASEGEGQSLAQWSAGGEGSAKFSQGDGKGATERVLTTRRWCPTSVCRCWKSCSIGWCG